MICGHTKNQFSGGVTQWFQCQLPAGHYRAETVLDENEQMIDYRVYSPHQYTPVDGDPGLQHGE